MTRSDSLPNDNDISGVLFKILRTFPDQRGFFREIIRHTDPFFDEGGFKQWSHSKMSKNVVKAWHYHHRQIDWWYIGAGQVEAVLFDGREESPTYKQKLVFKMGEGAEYGPDTHEVCVKIPPGVLHGLKVLSESAHLFYITSEVYNPDEEGRWPYNSEIVGHDWGIEAITSEQDRRTFVPAAERRKIR